ncbi:TetR/AcrR family transcriptional regulator [Janibacter corallicola]|uniref:TetR/AcrR family transcriptional regulator n=1 Tax=Janibacter corallicola TaxID=415212 RepID=UPI00082FE9F2|nr:TetR/AcrR family transcriptional regulator [Janibacter corallicola]
MTPRAKPLPPDERRRVLLDAARPLVREHGHAVRTKDVAAAAGVAEGTLYRVFETKEELVDAVVEDAADPAPFLARLDVIDPAQPLEERLLAVVSAFHERFREVFEILVAVGMPGPPESLRRRTGGHGEDDWRVGVRRRVVALLEPDADRLAISPERLAQYVRLLSFSGAHPHITAAEPLTPAEIVDVVLHGVLRRG